MSVRYRTVFCALVCGACVAASADSGAQAAPQFDIAWHITSAGGTQVRGGCFIVNGTAGQPAPGYSSGGPYFLLSGYWTVAPITGSDEIFFNGFEGCTP
jgi:hypothetical protein